VFIISGTGQSTYESTLLDTLMADLTLTEMELPLLQIICTQLYETRCTDEAQITLKMYEALGRAEGVLRNYLKGVLADRLGREEALARNVLKKLVRSDGMKQMLSYKMLAARVKTQRDELDLVLDRLVDARLLHREERAGEITYELAHEYLTREIVKWMNSADQEFKQAEELLERELINWRVQQHMLIPKSRLEVLYTYRERFKGLDAEAWECLISSALVEDFAIRGWVKTAGDRGELVLFQILKASDPQLRRRGVKTLMKLRTPHAVEPLIAALPDADVWVRASAAEALGALGDSRAVEPLIAALKDRDEGEEPIPVR
jgi:HEAT repeats